MENADDLCAAVIGLCAAWFARGNQLIVAGISLALALQTALASPALPDDFFSSSLEAPEQERIFAVPTSLDRLGRILAPVEINGYGPLRFILDTGANRSAMSAATAERLGLRLDTESTVHVHGITGSAHLPTVRVASFRAGDLALEGMLLPVLPASVFGNADGILGIDSLQSARIDVDFESGRVTIRRSPPTRSARGYLIIPGQVRHGGLLMVKARVGRVRVQAVLDTGAERSLGNEALRRSLLTRAARGRDEIPTTVIGATSQLAEGTSFLTPSITMGGATLKNLVVTFGDLHVFDVWSLNHQPALIVGMDLLGTVRQFVVDYPRREFYLRP